MTVSATTRSSLLRTSHFAPPDAPAIRYRLYGDVVEINYAQLQRAVGEAANGAEALRLGRVLLGSIEARTELLYGLRRPEGVEMSRLDYQMISCRE